MESRSHHPVHARLALINLEFKDEYDEANERNDLCA